MKYGDIVKFLQLIRAKNINVSPDHQWVRCSCPLSPFTHPSGTDNHPSFGIKVNNSGLSTFNCFTCKTGTLSSLLHILTWTVGVDPIAYEFFISAEFGLEEEATKQFSIDYKDVFDRETIVAKPVSVPGDVLDEYPLISSETSYGRYEINKAKEWLIGRGIDYDIASYYRIRVSPFDRAIVFSILDTDNITYLLHARSRLNKAFYYLNPANTGHIDRIWGRRDFWYGIQFVDMSKPIILVESETDLLRLRTLGVDNVIASCGPIGLYKLDRILAPRVYLGFDSDMGGAKYCFKAISHLHSIASLYRLSWSTVGVKDAGELKSRNDFDKVWKARKAIYLEGDQIMLDVSYNKKLNYTDPYAKKKGGVLNLSTSQTTLA